MVACRSTGRKAGTTSSVVSQQMSRQLGMNIVGCLDDPAGFLPNHHKVRYDQSGSLSHRPVPFFIDRATLGHVTGDVVRSVPPS